MLSSNVMSTKNADELLDKLLLLARLTLNEGERDEFARKFQSLLEFVDKVNESDAAFGVGRSESAGSLSYFDEMPVREDVPQAFMWGDDFVHNYVVPIVVGGGESDNVSGDSE